MLRPASRSSSTVRCEFQPLPKSCAPVPITCEGRLALRELEAAAGLGLAVLLALDDARVAGEEAGLLDGGAQRGLEAAQRLGDAVLDRTGLAGKAAADNRGFDVILAVTLGNAERLVDDQAKRRASEIDFLLAAVDDDLARARLQPDARDGVLAAAGRISAAMLVELLLAKHRLDLRALGRNTVIVSSFFAAATSSGFEEPSMPA